MATAPMKELTAEALKIYDRQRFIGLEVQKRLLNSYILLTPINSLMTELAKNLVLCGCNLAIFDNDLVSEDDIDTNFLLSDKDLGLNKAKIIRNKLLEMNPMVTVDVLDNLKEIEKFDILAISTGSFKEMIKWDSVSKEINKPVYILWSCGLYGFFYVSLGRDYRYEKTQKNEDEIKVQECHIVSRDLKEFFGLPLKKSVKDMFLGIKSIIKIFCFFILYSDVFRGAKRPFLS